VEYIKGGGTRGARGRYKSFSKATTDLLLSTVVGIDPKK